MKNYQSMTDEELIAAKRAADGSLQKLRQEKRELATLPEEEKPSAKAMGKLEDQIQQLRHVKREIQAEQDRRFEPPAAGDHVIGVEGIASAESVGNIGGKPAGRASTKK